MKRVLKTQDGKKVVINTETDPLLYKAPVNPPNTGTTFTRGSDLYYHKTVSGNEYYYLEHWSMWQGEEGALELISKKEAEDLLISKASLTGTGSLSEGDIEELKQYGLDLFAEDA